MFLLAAAPLAPFSARAQALGRIVSASVFPNPFDSRVKSAAVVYELDADSAVTLTIYDLFGRRVFERSFAAGAPGGRRGDNKTAWNGSGDGGGKVSKGIYFAVLRGASNLEVIKVGVVH